MALMLLDESTFGRVVGLYYMFKYDKVTRRKETWGE